MPSLVLHKAPIKGYVRARLVGVPEEEAREALGQYIGRTIQWRRVDYDYSLDTFTVKLLGRDVLVYRRSPGVYDLAPLALGALVRGLDERGHDLEVAGEPEALRPIAKSYGAWSRRFSCEWRGPEPRPYQEEAARLAAGTHFSAVEIATGGGKTLIAGLLLCRLRAPAVVLEPTVDLVEQTLERLRGYGLPACRDDPSCPVTVTTYQRFSRLHASGRPPAKAVMVADEGHHVPAATWRRPLLGWPRMAGMLLSARFDRGDSNTDVFTLARMYRKTYRELVSEGYVAPVEFRVAVVTGRLGEEALERLGGVLGSTYRQYRVRAARAVTEALEPALAEAAAAEAGAGRKVIVFVDYVDSVERVAGLLGEIGVEAAVLHGRLAADKRERGLERFRRGEARVLVASPAGNEGIDIPDADTALMPPPVPRELRLIQRVGRVTRPAPGKVSRAVVLALPLTRAEALRRLGSPYAARLRVWRDTVYADLARVANKYYGSSVEVVELLGEPQTR